jgi:excinuclease ABC subunit B
MQKTMDETARRRALQIVYNEEHGLEPTPLNKSNETYISRAEKPEEKAAYTIEQHMENIAADPVMKYMDVTQLEKSIKHTRKEMEKAAKDLDFVEAARLRDEMYALQRLMESKRAK